MGKWILWFIVREKGNICNVAFPVDFENTQNICKKYRVISFDRIP